MMHADRPEQRQARTHNQLRAFACRWYAGFDRRILTDDLLPYLPDDAVDFSYPRQPALTRVQDLIEHARQTARTVDRTAHYLGDIHVRELQGGLYELLCMHTYEAIPRGMASSVAMRMIGRMGVRLDMKTARDPEGANPKIVSYKATPTELPVTPVLANGNRNPSVDSPVSENDAKAFVYEWFALIDAGDSDALSAMVAENHLDVDILGTRLADAGAFREFLLAQRHQQRWSAHVPLDVRVDMANPTEPAVHFLLRFDGELVTGDRLQLANLTTWRLRFENGRLRLRRYRLVLL